MHTEILERKRHSVMKFLISLAMYLQWCLTDVEPAPQTQVAATLLKLQLPQ